MLLDEGFSVDCFERSDRVGGHWHTDYECLYLITPRDSSGFAGSRCRRGVQAAQTRFGRLDVLVNNAGVVRVAPVVDETDDGWNTTMAVNATGVFHGMRAEGDASVDITPIRRRAEPEEIAAAVAFLATDDAVYITGAELAVDGGYLAR